MFLHGRYKTKESPCGPVDLFPENRVFAMKERRILHKGQEEHDDVVYDVYVDKP